MSTYNDYMIKTSNAFTYLANLYCNQLSLGVADCCLRNKLSVIAMYLDSFPKMYVGACVASDDVTAMSLHLNTLLGYPGMGTISGTDIITPYGALGVITASSVSNEYAWNLIIGTTPTVITFTTPLGTSSTSWAMTYTVYTTDGLVADISITNRTQYGFTVTAYEENVHFEGNAMLIG